MEYGVSELVCVICGALLLEGQAQGTYTFQYVFTARER